MKTILIDFFAISIISLSVTSVSADTPCAVQTTDSGSVCVCNATYCDTVPPIVISQSGEYQLYSSSEANLGFWSVNGSFSNSTDDSDATITISDLNTTYQTIIGFGGALTDAAGSNIHSLSNNSQELLLQSYFGADGIQYSIVRIPIGGTDFSTRGYTYCDDEETLDSFALEEEDLLYKIPYALRAKEIRGEEKIKFFASAWSAPTWMKNTDKLNGFGKVQEKYYDTWAKYYIKFFDAYSENNITFWGVTTQNEPLDGLVGQSVQNNGFTTGEMKKWIKSYLGPEIRNSSYSGLKIIAHDDQRVTLPLLKLFVLSDDEVLSYVDGIGMHWYTDFFMPAATLDMAKNDDKELFRLYTEACNGYLYKLGLDKAVKLGSWSRAEKYINNIIEALEHDFGGWTDWNIALNETGGPNWINNEVDSAIIVNATNDEFYKQPMFYALGHFSKFIVSDSQRIEAKTKGSNISSVAFIRPDGKVVVVITNTSDKSKTVKVTVSGSSEVLTVEANSINTVLYIV